VKCSGWQSLEPDGILPIFSGAMVAGACYGDITVLIFFFFITFTPRVE